MTHPAFSPSTVDAAELDARTVGRAPLLKRLADRIVSSAQDGSRPHTLLVAPRGAGKTHTLQVAIHRALKQRKAAKATLLLALPEDALAIGDYPDLLVELLRTRDRTHTNEPRNFAATRWSWNERSSTWPRAAWCWSRSRTPTGFSMRSAKPGRAVSAPGSKHPPQYWFSRRRRRCFRRLSSRTHPWYGSFIIEELPDLTDTDVAELLAQQAHDRGVASYVDFRGLTRIDAVAQVVGWSPRVWQLIADTADRAALENVTPAADAALEQLTPHYQQLLWQLPAGEQRLIVRTRPRRRCPNCHRSCCRRGYFQISRRRRPSAASRQAAGSTRKADSGDRRATWYDLSDPHYSGTTCTTRAPPLLTRDMSAPLSGHEATP